MTYGGHSYGDTAIGDTEATDAPTFATQAITASYTTQQSTLSGTTTLATDVIDYDFSPQLSTISGTTLITSQPITAAYNLSESKLEAVLLTTPVDYSYNVETMAAQVPGTLGEITVQIDGERIDTYTNIEAKKRLNEVDTFSFQAFIEDSSDRALIQEGAEVKIIESYQDLLFKGVLNEVEYKSNFRAKCEGNGMVQKLLDRKTDRDTYTNSAGDDIVKAEVPETVMSYGTIESAPQVSVRFDHDNLARAVAGVANATAYDWYIDQDFDDQFDTDYLNFVQDAGRDAVQQTFAIGEDAQMVERNKDEGFVANDITLLGRGDGVNQLEANVFAASTKYTDTTEIITESETGSFTVEDAAQLGSVGDNLLIRAGIEVMDVDITDSSTLSINSRAQPDWESNDTPQIRHYEGVRVWTVENITQGLGRFTPESRDTAEDGSSIDTFGVKEQRETDKTIVDLSTLEKAADIDLKNRFEDVFRVKIDPTDPRVTRDLRLGDPVDVEDLTAMDVDDTFEVVGMDVKRNSAEEGTTLHLANRPRRLTERLSEMESNTDTLNAHMQGATNIDSQSFSDNCDATHPLDNSIYVPSDVVKVNKFQLTFKRESFRGYVQNTDHSHEVSLDVPEHDHEFLVEVPDHRHELGVVTGALTISSRGGPIAMYTTTDVAFGTAGSSDHGHVWPDTGNLPVQFEDVEIGYDTNETTASGGGAFVSDTTDGGGSVQTTETTENSGAPDYGIFEPSSEADVDVDIVVDGTTVDTVTGVSVGDELTDELALKQYLDDPIAGDYHDVELVPTGRCRLQADIFSKVFIESTL